MTRAATPGMLRLHRDRFPGRPVFDTAISHAMLRRVASGEASESLRLYAPDDAVLFSSLDARRPGFARACELAHEVGFASVIRLAGGHAAVFLEQSMAFAWAIPAADAHLHIRPRFERLASLIVASLRRLGLDARVGEVPGEYCPGEFSVNLGGRVKVMGVGQRVIRGAAHVGGVLTVAQSEEMRRVLVPIYEALELEMRPETAGAVADVEPGLGVEDVIESLLAVLRDEGLETQTAEFDRETRAAAERLVPHHAPDRVGEGASRRALHPADSKTLVHGSEGDGETRGVDEPASHSKPRG
jgi:lipoate-protein ligase A